MIRIVHRRPLANTPQDHGLVRLAWQRYCRPAHDWLLQRRDRHGPGINDLAVVLLSIRYVKGHPRRLVDPEVGQVVGVRLSSARKDAKLVANRVEASSWPVLQDPPQERQARRTLAVQFPAFGPPED